MTFSKMTLGAAGLVFALAFGAGAANAGGACCGSKKAAAKATTTASSCPSAKAAGGCGAQAMGACASKAKSAGACGSHGNAMQTAQVALPEGTEVTRVNVDGGIDLVFTGKDLAGIESFLNANMESCLQKSSDGKAAKAACTETCAVTKNEKAVVLSIRGQNAENCCSNWMQTASLTDESGAEKPAKGTKKI